MSVKLIFASKFYYRRGGLESYFFKCKEMLENNGHAVVPFTTDYAENLPTDYSKYFCEYLDLSRVNKLNVRYNIRAFKNMFFNREAYRCVKKLCSDESPQILQAFGVTRHLSPSIFKAAKDSGVKTVMRLSDYALMCPNSTALDGRQNICTRFDCVSGNSLKCIFAKCVQNSTAASIVGYLEVKGNDYLNSYRKSVDHWIAPSKFIQDIFIKYYKIPESKITYLPVFIDTTGIVPCYENEGYILYAGRLSREKGLFTLVDAVKGTGIRLKIAGTGPLGTEIKNYASAIHNQVEFLGHMDFNALKKTISMASLVVVPSEWFENSPNIVLEAYACGKPVIGADIGGIPEMIQTEQTGLLFEPGNAADLREKIMFLLDHPAKTCVMGKKARELVEDDLNVEKNYEQLIKIYRALIMQ